jgi:hypothetical protein
MLILGMGGEMWSICFCFSLRIERVMTTLTKVKVTILWLPQLSVGEWVVD